MKTSRAISLIIFALVLSAVACSADSTLFERFTVVETSSPYIMVLTPSATYPVLIEEYVPRIAIEGKWGTGTGEFIWISFSEAEEMGVNAIPSVAMNSKYDFYILDQFNNRIQKFDNHGRYVCSIPVLANADNQGKSNGGVDKDSDGRHRFYMHNTPYYRGIGIVVDSADNLYYLCAMMKEPLEGLVFKFHDDKLVQEWKIPLTATAGLAIDAEDNIWFGDYDVRGQKKLTLEEIEKRMNTITYGDYTLKKQIGSEDARLLIEKNSKPYATISIKPNRMLKANEKLFLNVDMLNKRGEIFISFSEGYGSTLETYSYKYSLSGQLESISEKPFGMMNRAGNIYYTSTNDDAKFRVIVKERKPKRK